MLHVFDQRYGFERSGFQGFLLLLFSRGLHSSNLFFTLQPFFYGDSKKIFLKIFIYLLSACYVPDIVGAVRTQILALMACIPNTFQGTFVGYRYESGTAGT